MIYNIFLQLPSLHRKSRDTRSSSAAQTGAATNGKQSAISMMNNHGFIDILMPHDLIQSRSSDLLLLPQPDSGKKYHHAKNSLPFIQGDVFSWPSPLYRVTYIAGPPQL